MKLDLRDFIDGADDRQLRKKEQDTVRIDTAIKAALEELAECEPRRAAFMALLSRVRSCTPLLRPTPRHGPPGWVGPVFLINRLKNLATRRSHWIRSCESWQPQDGNLRPVFRSLAHHLLTYYPVPAFMDSAWDLAAGAEAFRQQSWFIRLGRGTALRALNLPLSLTRSMEHYARHAPDHYTATQGLRFGETRGLRGSVGLAREIVNHLLGRSFEHSEFWRTVLIFFVAHPELKLEHVNPIIDFVQANKFGGEEIQTENGIRRRTAPWPDFSMKGRTLSSILRLVAVAPTEGDTHRLWRAAFGMAPARHLQINQETLDRRDQIAEGPRTSWMEAEPVWSSPRLHVNGRVTARSPATAVEDRSEEKRELARLVADEAAQIERAQQELARGRPIRLSDFGVLDSATFHLLLDLLGEALAVRTNPRQSVEAASMDGALIIRLGPADDPERFAEIVTSFGVLRGPDCEVTISYALGTVPEDLVEETILREF